MTTQPALHYEACQHICKIEQIVDELKRAGPHPIDGDNALRNVAEHLESLAQRAWRGVR